MVRVLAPLCAVVGLLCLVVGLVWAELDLHTMAGVRLVGLGAIGLLLGAALAGLHELTAARRR
jgi:hypothetical protein